MPIQRRLYVSVYYSFTMRVSVLTLYQIILVMYISFSQYHCEQDSTQAPTEKIQRRKPGDLFLPEMIVFNLDHSLWPFVMEYVQPPFALTKINRQIQDHAGRLFQLFPDVPSILEDLDTNWYKIGGISDNSDIRTVENITSVFDIDQFFNAFESIPGNKTEQIQRLSERAKVPLENILYFDTNKLDLEDMQAMNVTTVLLHPSRGITYAYLEQGFRIFKANKENCTTTTDEP